MEKPSSVRPVELLDLIQKLKYTMGTAALILILGSDLGTSQPLQEPKMWFWWLTPHLQCLETDWMWPRRLPSRSSTPWATMILLGLSALTAVLELFIQIGSPELPWSINGNWKKKLIILRHKASLAIKQPLLWRCQCWRMLKLTNSDLLVLMEKTYYYFWQMENQQLATILLPIW